MTPIHNHHLYQLSNFENSPETPPQLIQFIEKESVPGSAELRTIANGTTNEEVLRMLVHRLEALSTKLPSHETAMALDSCSEALHWLEQRTAGRKARNVEGTCLP